MYDNGKAIREKILYLTVHCINIDCNHENKNSLVNHNLFFKNAALLD